MSAHIIKIIMRNKAFLKDGLSGLIRIKNEERFIEPCIETCIDALDEMIIVYNDCTDKTPEIVEKMCKKYPDKIKAFSYNHNILSHSLSQEDYETAINLPEDSPRLHCNQCNYALSKVNYKYAVKIDVDQLYFTDELRKWRNVCSGEYQLKWKMSFIFGWIFMMYFSSYRRLSSRIGKPCLWMLPDWVFKLFIGRYLEYAKWRLKKGTATIALSGFNVFKDDKWFVTFDNYNPPYNGEGDTLIFRVSENTYYVRSANPLSRYVTEKFICPHKVMFAGPIWFHLHANRPIWWHKIKEIKDKRPDLFVSVSEFSLMSYKDVHKKMNKGEHTLYQRILFAFVHKMGKEKIQNHLYLLK